MRTVSSATRKMERQSAVKASKILKDDRLDAVVEPSHTAVLGTERVEFRCWEVECCSKPLVSVTDSGPMLGGEDFWHAMFPTSTT